MRKWSFACLALALIAAPALADETITAGIDIFETKGNGDTYTDVNLPAGFFCTTSAAFSGRITLVGDLISTNPADVLGKTDTVIERLDDASFGGGNTTTARAIVRAATFKSTSPISVSGCAGSTDWDVKSIAAGRQSEFDIDVTRTLADGGTFDSSVSVNAIVVFTQQGSGVQRSLSQSVTFSTEGAEWTHQPGSGGVTYTNSVTIDTDGDGSPDTTVPGTSNFAPGWSKASGTTQPVRIPHQAPQHSHFVLPPPPFCKAVVIDDTEPVGNNLTGNAVAAPAPFPCAKKSTTTSTN